MFNAQGSQAEAIKNFRASLAVRERLAATDPDNVPWQFDLVLSNWNLAALGDEPTTRRAFIVATMGKLKDGNKLGAREIRWLADAGRWLPELRSIIPVDQIAGTYTGTNRHVIIGTQVSAEDKISLTFEQSGSAVRATYQTSKGSHGNGSGTVIGNTISAMTLQSETAACLGSFNASLTFSGDTVNWSYTGQDCAGPVQGMGQAEKE